MPLRCVNARTESIEADGLTDRECNDLGRKGVAVRNLTLPCCSEDAVPRTSKSGIRYFAHHRKDARSWKPESEVHNVLKAIALKAAREAGWNAQTEVREGSPEGEPWIADVLADKGESRFAIEIEWRGQDNEELKHRQARYVRSGVQVVWLLRQPGFPGSPDFPAACVGGNIDDGLEILMPDTLIVRASQRKEQPMWEQVSNPDSHTNVIAFAGGSPSSPPR